MAIAGLLVWAASLAPAVAGGIPDRPWAEQDRRAGLTAKAAAGPPSFEIDADTVFVVDGKAVTFAAFQKLEGLTITALEVEGGRAVKVEARTR